MSDRDIRYPIQRIAGTDRTDTCKYVFCSVDSVDVSNRKCECTPQGDSVEAPFTNVLLMASVDDGLLYVPALNSTVVVAYSEFQQPYIALFSELQRIFLVVGNSLVDITGSLIKLNDGSFGGLVKVAQLTQKLNNLENLVNDLVSKFNSHTHILTLTSGTGTAAPTAAPETTVITPTQQSDIENTKITHGQ